MLLNGCAVGQVDIFKNSVAPISKGETNPPGPHIPKAPFICDAPLGESRPWFFKVEGGFTMRARLRFLEPRLQADKLWPAARIFVIDEKGLILGGAQLANFFFLYMAAAIGNPPEEQSTEEQASLRPLGAFQLGEDVTFVITWTGEDVLQVGVRPLKEHVREWTELTLDRPPAALAIACQSSRVEILSVEMKEVEPASEASGASRKQNNES